MRGSKHCKTGLCADSYALKLLESGSPEFSKIVNRWHDATRRSARYEVNSKTAEILIYGPIGEDFFGKGVTAKWVKSSLDSLGKEAEITVRIDSPGGLINEGSAIYNLLVTSGKKINVIIDGFAASAASFVAMAGDHIAIGEGSYIMIHDARGIMYGTASDMRREAAILESMSNTICDRYVARTGVGKAKITQWMSDETWFSGKEAVDQGFADELIDNKRRNSVASAYADAFGKYPVEARPNLARAARLLANIQ